MTSQTVTNFDPALKQLYKPANVRNMVLNKRPAFGLIGKFEGFGGRDMPIVLQYSNPQGRSNTFSDAKANRTPTKLEDFKLTRAHNYMISSIDGEAIAATRNDNYAFLAALKTVIDGSMNTFSNDIETNIFRDTTGAMAQLSTATAPTVADPMVLTLRYNEEITLFEVGMSLECYTDATMVTEQTTPTVAVIDAISASAATLTTDYDNSGGTTTWSTSDFLGCEGDNLSKMAGFASWCPASDPTAGESFFSVDRSVNYRLYGQVFDGTLDNIEDTLIQAQSQSALHGGDPDLVLLNHAHVRRLVMDLGSRKVYAETQAAGPDGMLANVGYRSVVVQGDHGTLDVVAANKCQATVGWVLQKNTWTLNTAGPAVGFLNEDMVGKILRLSDEDGYETRIGHYGNISCDAPLWNVRVSLSDPSP